MNKKNIKIFLFFVAIGALVTGGIFFYRENRKVETFQIDPNEDDVYFQNNQKSVDQRLENLKAYMKKVSESEVKIPKSKVDIETEGEIYERKSRDVARYLQQVATEERESGKPETASELEEIAQNQNDSKQVVTEKILTLEKKSKWRTFWTGPDYDAINEIKTALPLNKKKIVEVAGLMENIHSLVAKNSVEQQLTLLMGERERIKKIITTYENKFSLFGWFVRWRKGYEKMSLDSSEEQEVMAVVEKAFRTEPREIVAPPVYENSRKKENTAPPEEQVSPPASSENQESPAPVAEPENTNETETSGSTPVPEEASSPEESPSPEETLPPGLPGLPGEPIP